MIDLIRYDINASAPKRALPYGACDTHTHVFGPSEQFPFKVPPAYSPPYAPVEKHLQMLDIVGIDHAILVQPAPYGDDCSLIVDSSKRSAGRLKGIGTAFAATSEHALAELVQGGVVGLRFVETGGSRMPGAATFDDLAALHPLMANVGLHAQIWADCARIAEQHDWLTHLGLPVVIEHMGRFDPVRGPEASEFQILLAMLREEAVWVKLGVCRTGTPPDYVEARPFHDALIEANPRRLLWASDWPFVKIESPRPDPGAFVDLFDAWTCGDEALRRLIFVDNPATLYGFDT